MKTKELTIAKFLLAYAKGNCMNGKPFTKVIKDAFEYIEKEAYTYDIPEMEVMHKYINKVNKKRASLVLLTIDQVKSRHNALHATRFELSLYGEDPIPVTEEQVRALQLVIKHADEDYRKELTENIVLMAIPPLSLEEECVKPLRLYFCNDGYFDNCEYWVYAFSLSKVLSQKLM